MKRWTAYLVLQLDADVVKGCDGGGEVVDLALYGERMMERERERERERFRSWRFVLFANMDREKEGSKQLSDHSNSYQHVPATPP